MASSYRLQASAPAVAPAPLLSAPPRPASSSSASASASASSGAASSGTTALGRAVSTYRTHGSSEANVASYMAATEGMTGKAKQAYLLKKRADESRLQQLRGIFASYDEDRDGVLSKDRELPNALLALGFEPSARAVQRFVLASPSGAVDLATFVRICMTRSGAIPGVPGPDEAETTEATIAAVFSEFDPARTGRVPLSTLLHVLAEVDSPTALGVDEVQELLRMTGVLNETTLRDPRTLYAMEVDYRAFVRHLMFAASAPATAGAGAGGAQTAPPSRGPASASASASASAAASRSVSYAVPVVRGR